MALFGRYGKCIIVYLVVWLCPPVCVCVSPKLSLLFCKLYKNHLYSESPVHELVLQPYGLPNNFLCGHWRHNPLMRISELNSIYTAQKVPQNYMIFMKSP